MAGLFFETFKKSTSFSHRFEIPVWNIKVVFLFDIATVIFVKKTLSGMYQSRIC